MKKTLVALLVVTAALGGAIAVACGDSAENSSAETATGGSNSGSTGGGGGEPGSATGGSSSGGSSSGGSPSGGGTTGQPTPEEQAFLGSWTEVSQSTDGSTCPPSEGSGSGMGSVTGTGDGHLVVSGACPLTLTVTGSVAKLPASTECTVNETSKFVFNEYTWELTGEGTSRITFNAKIIAGDFSCDRKVVTELKR